MTKFVSNIAQVLDKTHKGKNNFLFADDTIKPYRIKQKEIAECTLIKNISYGFLIDRPQVQLYDNTVALYFLYGEPVRDEMIKRYELAPCYCLTVFKQYKDGSEFKSDVPITILFDQNKYIMSMLYGKQLTGLDYSGTNFSEDSKVTDDYNEWADLFVFLVNYTYNPDKYLKIMTYADYLLTPHWQQTSGAAKSRAGHRCQLCNTNKQTLHTHHRTYENRGSEEDSDLTVLCEDCHRMFHNHSRLSK